MRKIFPCSLVYHGILGGFLILEETAITYQTQKLTVDPKWRNLRIPLDFIRNMIWNRTIFPQVSFEITDGTRYTFLIFNSKRFRKCWKEIANSFEKKNTP